jgi:IMP dehydrogenase
MIIKEALAFDDVLLVPCYTEVRSRTIPDLTSYIAGMKLTVPIISSPMDTVTESDMAIAMGKAGGMGIIHRFMSTENQIDNIRSVETWERLNGVSIPKVFAVGVGKEELHRFKEVYNSVPVDAVAIDVANGHSSYMRDMIH